MTNKEKTLKNLIKVLSLFEGRSNHLAKFLIDNELLNNAFLSRLKTVKDIDIPHFLNINEMDDFFEGIIKSDSETEDELIIKFNNKLNELIKNEQYEKAIGVRDYMIRKKIKRI